MPHLLSFSFSRNYHDDHLKVCFNCSRIKKVSGFFSQQLITAYIKNNTNIIFTKKLPYLKIMAQPKLSNLTMNLFIRMTQAVPSFEYSPHDDSSTFWSFHSGPKSNSSYSHVLSSTRKIVPHSCSHQLSIPNLFLHPGVVIILSSRM